MANVVTNTSSKNNSGNSVLLECIKTITCIESSQTLKTLAIKVTSQLLKTNDNNGKYVSLYTLNKMISIDLNTIVKHSQLIVDCIMIDDNSIKTLAIDLLIYIVNKENVKAIVD